MARRRPDAEKVERLKKHGVLNPRFDDVTDPLFVEDESAFFDARDLVQVKYEMLRKVSIEKRSIVEASSHAGLSKPSFYKAQSDFEEAGLLGLIPRKRGPKGPHKLNNQIIEKLRAAVSETPTRRASDLVEIAAKRFGVRVHKRTVERALSRREKKLQ